MALSPKSKTASLRFVKAALALTILLTTFASCNSKDFNDPCNDVLNEAPPTYVGLFIKDKQTSEPIFKAHPELDSTDIKITLAETGDAYTNNYGFLYGEQFEDNPNYGLVLFSIISKNEGEHLFNIKIGDIATLKFGYTVEKREQKPSPCGLPYFMTITDVRVEDHPFVEHEYSEGKTSPNIIEVSL